MRSDSLKMMIMLLDGRPLVRVTGLDQHHGVVFNEQFG